jgi:hypothetical protein
MSGVIIITIPPSHTHGDITATSKLKNKQMPISGRRQTGVMLCAFTQRSYLAFLWCSYGLDMRHYVLRVCTRTLRRLWRYVASSQRQQESP